MRNWIAAAPKSGKNQYSEHEAAEELGVSVDQLRMLIRDHIVNGEDGECRSLPLATFQPSDLVVLRILAAMPPGLAEG